MVMMDNPAAAEESDSRLSDDDDSSASSRRPNADERPSLTDSIGAVVGTKEEEATRTMGAGPSMYSHVAYEVTRADATTADRAYWFGMAMMITLLQLVILDCMNYSQNHQKCTTDDDCPYTGTKGVQICAFPFEPSCYPCSAGSKFDGHGAGKEGRLGDYREVLDDANFTRQRLLWQDDNAPGIGRWATCWKDPTFESCANTSEVNPFKRCVAREAKYAEYENNALHVNPATRKAVRLDIYGARAAY